MRIDPKFYRDVIIVLIFVSLCCLAGFVFGCTVLYNC